MPERDQRRVPGSTLIFASAIFLISGLSSPALAQPEPSLQPGGWDAGVALTEARSTSADPSVVEVTLTARTADVEVAPGRTVHAWTYDGRIPGPLIRAHVGDRVIVHFTNQLPDPTTVHWHGVRVPIEMDGVPGISQPEVPPGGTFTYDFIARDAGLFWYHPHVMSAAQVGFGLYGALLVEDPHDAVGVADQLTLVLSDIGFDESGKLDSPASGGSAGTVFGREGDYILVNGRIRPTLTVRNGAPQRWRIVNAAKSRYFRLDLEGQPFTVIGTDGGLQESPRQVDALLVTPGERVDVIVAPRRGKSGTLQVRSRLYDRGYGSIQYRTAENVFAIAFTDQAPLARRAAPDVHRAITPPDISHATKVDVVLTLPPAGPDGTSEFDVNGVPSWRARPYPAALGEVQVWTIRNESRFAHPFHLHGFFMLPLDDALQPLRPMAWKDTINVPVNGTVRFAVAFDERPGLWMFHCHILDHAEAGLMGHVSVGGDAATHRHNRDATR
ncbi:MAG TPA: multicopper oxidase family protein [Vicinamibacterales bacterium]|nr:multicopper oxidase family protein [Vicinamibacterales bacterium]